MNAKKSALTGLALLCSGGILMAVVGAMGKDEIIDEINSNPNLHGIQIGMSSSETTKESSPKGNHEVLTFDHPITSYVFEGSIADIEIVSGEVFRIETFDLPLVSESAPENQNMVFTSQENGQTLIQNLRNDISGLQAFSSSTHPRLKITVSDQMTDLQVSVNVGDITINHVQTKNLKLTSSVGDIEGEDLQLSFAQLRSDVGDIDLNRSVIGSATLENDTGSIEFRGTIQADGSALSDTGSIHLYLDGDPSRYSITSSIDLGDEHIDPAFGGGPVRIDVQSDLGDIDVLPLH